MLPINSKKKKKKNANRFLHLERQLSTSELCHNININSKPNQTGSTDDLGPGATESCLVHQQRHSKPFSGVTIINTAATANLDPIVGAYELKRGKKRMNGH